MPVPPSQLDPVVTADIDAVTLKALAKDPADRYQSAREMRTDITRVLSGQQATAVVPRLDQDAMATQRAPVMAASQTRIAPPPPPPTTVAPVADDTYDEEPEGEEPPKSRVGLAILVTAIILLVLGGGAFALYRLLTPNQPTVQQVEVPNVLTYTETQATEQLVERQLKVEVKSVNGKDDDTKGTVVDQNPKGGALLPVDSTVTITVNAGPKKGKVPGGLVGKDLDEVRAELEEAGFTNVDTKAAKEEDPDSEPNEVLSVSPKSGSSVALDAKITVSYATGKSRVPNFEGVTEQRARELAEDAGFGTPEFSTEVSDQPPGTVIAQRPKAETLADRTTTIRLTLAATPPPPSQPPSTPPTSSAAPTPTPTVTPS
jgi:serine/threonine-protein kinase